MKITRCFAALSAALFAFALLVIPVQATTQWPTATGAPGDTSVSSIMFGCENGSGQWVPATTAGQCLGSGGGGGSSTPFTPSGIFGSLTATASASASTALPTNTGTVEFSNLTSAYISCVFASGTATGLVNSVILPPLSVKDIGVSGFNNVSCIDQTGSTGSNQVLMAGGSGNGTGFGGGSSGGGGGTVAQGAAGVSAWLVTGTGGTFPVTGTFWPYTLGQQVAASSVPVILPSATITTLTPPSNTGYSTAAKQPALGTAGSPSTDVISVQGVASGTPQPMSVASGAIVDGADVAQGSTTSTACPSSGTATVIGCLRSAVNNPVTLGSASGGLSTKTLAALSNTAIAVKAAAGQVYSAQCSNSDATHWAYIQIFNVAAASVTMGTTAPTKFVGIPPGSNTGFTFSLVGDQYSTAISAGAASTSTGGTGPTTALDCTVDFL